MIHTLKKLNYYNLIGCVDFALSVFVGARMLELDMVATRREVGLFSISLRIPDFLGELSAAYLQNPYENYAAGHTFPQYEIFEDFADWEFKNGRCQKVVTE